MHIRIGEIEARTIRDGLRTLLRVVHAQREVFRRVISAASMNVGHPGDLVTSIASILIPWIVWCRRACIGVARARVGRVEVVGARARVYVPQASAKISPCYLIKLVEYSYQPRARAIVAVVVVVGGGIGKSGVAFGTVATARGAAGVLDGEHLYARLHPARPREIEHATRR